MKKDLDILIQKANGKSGRTSFFVRVCIQDRLSHLSHFFIHMKDLKLPNYLTKKTTTKKHQSRPKSKHLSVTLALQKYKQQIITENTGK